MKVIETAGPPVHPDGESHACGGASRSAPVRPNDRVARISLKQWRLFHAVVDNDGFVGAANKLHISQSSISHALAKLQDQLGIPLLTLVGRKAHITEQGRALLGRSRDLVREAVQLEEFGDLLRLGWEPEVRLAVEANFPAELVMRTVRDLSKQSQDALLNVSEVGLAELRNSLYTESVDLAISSATVSGFSSNKLIEIEHIAVAHADNPLFKINRAVTFGDLRGHFQIVFGAEEYGAAAAPTSPAAPTQRSWKVNSLDSAAAALRFGLGYAWLPRYRVQRWLDDGSVRILPLESGSSYTTQMHLIRGRAAVAGSNVLRFADLLQKTATEYAALPGSLSTGGAAGDTARGEAARRHQGFP